LITNLSGILTDLEDVVRMFFPDYKRGDSDGIVCEVLGEQELSVRVTVGDSVTERAFSVSATTKLERTRLVKRYAKIALYDALKERTGKAFPWGSLTGIRPTRLAYMLRDEGVTDVEKALVEQFDVRSDLARTVTKIMQNQSGLMSDRDRDAALYLHIPVCPTRCYYCSFPTVTLARCKNLDVYVDSLIDDVRRTCRLLQGVNVTSVYVGGGTPTVLSAEQLDRVLRAVPYKGVEFTVEAGRPDTADAEKFAVMKKNGVTRVSINPQTFDDDTLQRIGRKHTARQVEECYAVAKEFGFTVNMDLIAGLWGEDEATFRRTIDRTTALRPENVTVHTLCAKRGSELGLLAPTFSDSNPYIAAMTDYAAEAMEQAGYEPYYLYRQKNMLDNLQNVGYTLPGYACKNNVDTMEECVTVAACGSGAISKVMFPNGRIERLAMVKPIEAYVERFEEMMQKKSALLNSKFGEK